MPVARKICERNNSSQICDGSASELRPKKIPHKTLANLHRNIFVAKLRPICEAFRQTHAKSSQICDSAVYIIAFDCEFVTPL